MPVVPTLPQKFHLSALGGLFTGACFSHLPAHGGSAPRLSGGYGGKTLEIQSRESQREAEPLLHNYFPLSFEGEGDTGGEVDNK